MMKVGTASAIAILTNPSTINMMTYVLIIHQTPHTATYLMMKSIAYILKEARTIIEVWQSFCVRVKTIFDREEYEITYGIAHGKVSARPKV